jgi:hypothetical protein
VKDRRQKRCDGTRGFCGDFSSSQGSNAGVNGKGKSELRARIFAFSIPVLERFLFVAKLKVFQSFGLSVFRLLACESVKEAPSDPTLTPKEG